MAMAKHWPIKQNTEGPLLAALRRSGIAEYAPTISELENCVALINDVDSLGGAKAVLRKMMCCIAYLVLELERRV